MITEIYQVRAKHKQNGTWMVGVPMKIEGKYMLLLEDDENLNRVHYTDDEMWMSEVYAVEIDENTICRPIKSTDKKGNKIWEHDILNADSRIFTIGYYEPFAMYMLKGINHNGGTNGMNVQLANSEVIGNIFDNPELLVTTEN